MTDEAPVGGEQSGGSISRKSSLWSTTALASRLRRNSSLASPDPEDDDSPEKSLANKSSRRPSLAPSIASNKSMSRIARLRSIGSIASRKASLHSPPLPSISPAHLTLLPLTSSRDTSRALLFTLPNELLIQILVDLDIQDLYVLRRTSQILLNLVSLLQREIVHHHVKYRLEPLVLQLYPPPSLENMTIGYLAGIEHRKLVSKRLAHHVANYVRDEIYQSSSGRRKRMFEARHETLCQQMFLPIFTIFHFLENLREVHIDRTRASLKAKACNHDHHDDLDESRCFCREAAVCFRDAAIYPSDSTLDFLYDDMYLEGSILIDYEAATLLAATHMFTLLKQALERWWRPPSYAGRIERTLRAMPTSAPEPRAFVSLLILGGLREVERTWRPNSVIKRRKILDQTVERLQCTDASKWDEETHRWAKNPDFPMPPITFHGQMYVHFLSLWRDAAIMRLMRFVRNGNIKEEDVTMSYMAFISRMLKCKVLNDDEEGGGSTQDEELNEEDGNLGEEEDDDEEEEEEEEEGEQLPPGTAWY